MATNKTGQPAAPASDVLESYRRLVELQKQVIKLAEEHARTQRECEALRLRVAREAFESAGHRRGFRRHVRTLIYKLLPKRPPENPAPDVLPAFDSKQASC